MRRFIPRAGNANAKQEFTPATAKATKANTATTSSGIFHLSNDELPLQDDRLLLLRAVMDAADHYQAERTASDAPNSAFITQSARARFHQRNDRYQKRLQEVLQEELVPAAAVALQLVDSTSNGHELELEVVCILAKAAYIPISRPPSSTPTLLACITLLLSRIVLRYGNYVNGGYDARVRHVLKVACVHILSMSLLKESERDPKLRRDIDDLDESLGAVFGAKRVSVLKKSQLMLGSEQDSKIIQKSDDHKLLRDFHTGDDSIAKLQKSCSGLSLIDDEPYQKKSSKEVPHDNSDDNEEEKKEEYDPIADKVTKEIRKDATCSENNQSSACVPLIRQKHARSIATRKFEAIERIVATHIFKILLVQADSTLQLTKDVEHNMLPGSTNSKLSSLYSKMSSRKSVVRGLQITSMGVFAGTLFAVTGGLAGPAIAAGIAGLGLAASSSTAATVAMLTTVHAAAAMFGAGGGGLAMYKMKKRTAGLKEFRIRRENIEQNVYEGANDEAVRRAIQASFPQLHSTVCISGWLMDDLDYQRPWGIQPTSPPMEDEVELLRRFYLVHDPKLVATCEDSLKKTKRELNERYRWDKSFHWDGVCKHLEKRYGRSPKHLLPLDGPSEALSFEEDDLVTRMLSQAIGPNSHLKHDTPTHKTGNPKVKSMDSCSSTRSKKKGPIVPLDIEKATTSLPKQPSWFHNSSSRETHDSTKSAQTDTPILTDQNERVWDYQSLYGSGDMYTVTWESKLLLSLCHIVSTMAQEATTQTTKLALQYSFIGAVVAAVAPVSALITASQLIDDPYQIVILRADEAGKELANCLLESNERRPVTLVGFSFGARMIFACLAELARHQDLWENSRRDAGGIQHADTHEPTTHPIASNNISDQPTPTSTRVYTREPASIVEDVVLMGLPRIIDTNTLTSIRQVTSGRIMNCYKPNDWLLSLMFLCRGRPGTQTCGTHPIVGVTGIENFNVTNIVESHAEYGDSVPELLQLVGFHKPGSLSLSVTSKP